MIQTLKNHLVGHSSAGWQRQKSSRKLVLAQSAQFCTGTFSYHRFHEWVTHTPKRGCFDNCSYREPRAPVSSDMVKIRSLGTTRSYVFFVPCARAPTRSNNFLAHSRRGSTAGALQKCCSSDSPSRVRRRNVHGWKLMLRIKPHVPGTYVSMYLQSCRGAIVRRAPPALYPFFSS
jgi:hypothetical protein